jgi:type IV secretion system protein VirB1
VLEWHSNVFKRDREHDESFTDGGNILKLEVLGFFSLQLISVTNAQAQHAHVRLSQAEFVSLAARCAPGAPPDTLLAIARTESGLYANALSINRPNDAARRAGYSNGQLVMTRQPKDRREATYWLRWFGLHRYTVSIGLMQVNGEMAAQFHLKPEQLFEPCTNIRVGAAILISVYTDLAREMGEGYPALDAALSFYNSGNLITGFRNGYVSSVYAHAPRRSVPF